MRRLAAALAIGALIALGLWWRASSSAGIEPVRTSELAPSAAEVAGDADEMSAATTEVERASVPDDASSKEASAPLVIEVVDTASGAPVAGAQVFIEREDVDDIERLQVNERFGFSGPAIAPLLGVEHRSDEHGVVRTAPPTCSITIWASAGHRHGEVDIDAGATNARIELALGHCIAVDVVDRAGRPVSDVRVAVIAPDLDEWTVAASAVTDAAGRVALHMLESNLEDESNALRVATTFVACSPEFVEFTLAPLPNEPLRFVIEDNGAVELTVTNARGEALPLAARLGLSLDDERAGDLPFGISAGERLFLPTSDGRARFERIGLGLPLAGYASLEGYSFTERMFDGPVAANDVVRISVPVEAADAIVRGRIVDVDGHGLGARRISATAQLTYADGSGSNQGVFRATTTEDGTFETRLSRSSGKVTSVVAIRASLAGSRSSSSLLNWPQPRIDPVPVPHDVYELGDVVVALAPLFVTGRVIDESGEPFGSAEVGLMEQGSNQDEYSGLCNERTDRLGRFEIGFEGTGENFVLTTVADNCVRFEPIEVRRGDRDVVLQLHHFASASLAYGSLAGTILLPGGLTMEVVHLGIARVDATGRHSPRGFSQSDTGAFEVNQALAGQYSVSVRFDASEIARVEGLEVRANETTRIAPIDLRERLQVLRFELVDEMGAPLSTGGVSSINGDDEYVNDAPAKNGVVLLPSLTPRLNVFASSPGRRSVRFVGVESGAKLALPAGIVAKLRGPALGRDADEYEFTMTIDYFGDDEGGWFSDTATFVLAPDGSARVALPIAGEYVVESADLVNKLTRARFEVVPKYTSEQRPPIVVTDEASEALITLPPDARSDALRRAKQN